MGSAQGTGFFGIAWWVWGLLCLALAIVWTFIWPTDRVTADTPALAAFLIRWGHAATWYLLAANFFVRQWLPGATTFANLLALGGLAAYIGFMVSAFVRR